MNLNFLKFWASKAEAVINNTQFKVYTEDELKVSAREVGGKVEMIDAEGKLSLAPDGTYELQGGFIFEVKDGLITSIEGEYKPVEDKPAENMEEQTTDVVAEDKSVERLDTLEKKVDELGAILNKAIEQLNAVTDKMNRAAEATNEDVTEMKANMSAMVDIVKLFAKTPVQPSKDTKRSNYNTDTEERNRQELLNAFKRIQSK